MNRDNLDIAEIESNHSNTSTSTIRPSKKKPKRFSILTFYIFGIWTWTAYSVYNDPTFFYAFRSHPETQAAHDQSLFYSTSDTSCPFPLPKTILNENPLRADEESIIKVSKELDKFLQGRVSQSDIDSLSIAIVTPFGNLFEKSYGILKANETVFDSTTARPVSRDSIYRVASISKMFTMLETLVLRERGVLNLDDPVEKYLPEIRYPTYGWSDYLKGKNDDDQKNRPQITLRQLASHMSGIGRDYPPIELNEWPSKSPIPLLLNSNSKFPIHIQDDLPLPNRSYESLKDSINKYPLINLPYSFPIYSNSGIDLLGLANVAANKLASASVGGSSSNPGSSNEPRNHAELLQRDIFGPLGLNRSFFKVPYGNELLVRDLAIPKDNSEWIDFEFDNSDAPAGGQYTSLSDLSTTLRSFLNPELNNGVVSSNVIREWLHPMYTWRNGFQEVGAPWEINILNDGHRTRMYTKSGNLPGYHSEFVIVPDYSFGIIVLLTGTYSNTASIVQETTTLFHPIIQNLLEQRVKEIYVGKWISNESKSTSVKEESQAQVELIKGGLYLTKLIIRNDDVLKIIQDADISFSGKVSKPYPIALWNTERSGEFRLAFGRKTLYKDPSSGCMPYWISIDNGLFSRGAPIDLIYWDGDKLVYPSGGVRFIRA